MTSCYIGTCTFVLFISLFPEIVPSMCKMFTFELKRQNLSHVSQSFNFFSNCFSHKGVLYIGSHSHLFVALDIVTGESVWETTLPDRVESSACLSYCGQWVIVGKSLFFRTVSTLSVYLSPKIN